MPSPELYSKFGIHVLEGFLEPSACVAIRDEMRAASESAATVAAGADYARDEDYRRTKMAEVSDATRQLVGDRLAALQPSLEDRFSLSLTSYQRPQFLVYREGDFFRPHPDNAVEIDTPDEVKARRLSLVLFLNGEGQASVSGTYEGGELTFHVRMQEDPRARSVGLPVKGQEGAAVAFRSEFVHSVTAVTRGERFTVVSWFF